MYCFIISVTGYPGAFLRIAPNVRVADCGSSDCVLDLAIYVLIFLLGKVYVRYLAELGML